MTNSTSKFIKAGIVTCFTTICLGLFIMMNNAYVKPTCAMASEVIIIEQIDTNDAIRDSMNMIKNDIIVEMNLYISTVAPQSEVDSSILFDLCDNYNVDVRFVMAQAQVESHYATKGTAKRTKSIFNVGAYDGHSANRQMRNGFGYDNPNESIEPYLILITTDYLVDNKTTNDLLNNYVNHLGMRYASNPRYERMLKSVYNRINNTTDLDMLIIEYNKYKEIIGNKIYEVNI